eukprot:15467998-Alexandrium_andersonii.AAC.1
MELQGASLALVLGSLASLRTGHLKFGGDRRCQIQSLRSQRNPPLGGELQEAALGLARGLAVL